MFNLRIDIDISEAENKLAGMLARSHDFHTVFERARLKLMKANAANFATGGLPVGGWLPREQPAAWPLLRRTGRLAGDLATLVGPANVIHATSAQFGTEVDYAKFHQSGTHKMPARKVVFEPRGFAREVAEDAAQHIVGLNRYFS